MLLLCSPFRFTRSPSPPRASLSHPRRSSHGAADRRIRAARSAARPLRSLTFRGGLSLTSSHPEFGGISAIRVQADGASFISVSDKGRWIRGRIVYDGTRPVGIADAEIAPVLGPDGRTLSARGWYDTESIAEDGGTVWLGIERVNRIVRFDIGKHGLLARGQPIAVPPGISGCRTTRDWNASCSCRAACRSRHIDRDLGARARSGGQHPGLPARRSEPR